MKKNDIMMYAMIAGGAYLIYWYLTKNGPSPGVTYWDSWFGGQAAAPGAGTPTQTGTQSQLPPTSTTTGSGTAATDIRTKLLTATGGVNNLNADQWNYYRNNLFPPALTADQFSRAFPVRTDPMPSLTVDQFLAALNAAGVNAATGLGNIVPTQSVASIPSMSFGGSLRTAVPGSPSAFRGGGIQRGRGQGGGYIQ